MEESKELAVCLHAGEGGGVENIYYETISRTTTLCQLKQRLPEEVQNLLLFYNNHQLDCENEDESLWDKFLDDANPVLAAHKPTCVLLHFCNKNLSKKISVTTIGELKSSVQQILKSKAGGGILVDLRCNAQSLLSTSSSNSNDTLVATLSSSSEEKVVVNVVVGGGSFPSATLEGQRPAKEPAFFTKFVDAQFTKDRMSKLNDMNFNNLVLAGAIEHVSSHPRAKLCYPQELDMLMKTHQQASELLLKAMDMYASQFALGGNRFPSPEQQQQQAETQPEAAAPQQDMAAAAAAEQRAGRRRQLLVGMELGLLVKLVVMVLLMGYDSGAQEFTIMCTVAALIYIANIGLVRVPVVMQQWFGMRGRIPHERRAGFFIDLYTVVMSLLLSIIPVWTVQGEEEEAQPAGAEQVVL